MIRQSLTSLSKRPWLSSGIVATLGLALAATLLVAGLVNTYLVRPLPYGDATRLVTINEHPLTGQNILWRMTYGNAVEVYEHAASFSRKAIIRNESFTVRAPGGVETAFVQRVTPEFFPMLGVKPLFGETIHAANAEIGGERALLLSYEFWQRRFGGDRNVLGQSVQLDQRSYRVVGVLPAAVVLPHVGEGQQAWAALLPVDFIRDERYFRRHMMLGELAPGKTLAAAQTELTAISAALRRDYPAQNSGRGINAVGLRESLLGNLRQQLLILQGAVGLVLVVACVNAGCLLLAQAIRRRREFALRLALGAGTRDLFRQFFAESLWLSLGAATLGLLLATWLSPLAATLLPGGVRQLPAPGITGAVVVCAAAMAIVIAVAFSLVPLMQARRLNIEATLRDGSRQLGSVAGGAATRLLVSLQIAIALALLITAVQLVRSFQAVQTVDRGIPVEQLYAFRLGTRGAAYADDAARIRYFEGVAAQLRTLPHVAEAGISDAVFPNVLGSYSGFTQEGDGLLLTETPKRAVRRAVSPELLDALQLKIIAGRWLSADDRANTARVAVISQSLAEKYWPGQDPLGKRVRFEGREDWSEIVGIVSDIISHGAQPAVIDSFFLPHAQITPIDTGVVVRVRGTQPLTRDQVDRAVAAVDLNNTAYAYVTASEFFANSAWQTRFGLILVGSFAGLAVTLCLTGVYAVLAFAVAGRTAEFGVRLALGARRPQVAALVLRDAARMTVPGLLAGTLLAWFAARSVDNLLYGVAPLDILAYAAAGIALALACAAACLMPAFRAMRVDPLTALRGN
ncbi:ADOP family duplicated permease [Oleiharenicola lentus]|uniref:ADOP family duplicated permease n=1 Tax=Oleiharenicola lentus TaxID=2508720 RepID=UPI003F679E3B